MPVVWQRLRLRPVHAAEEIEPHNFRRDIVKIVVLTGASLAVRAALARPTAGGHQVTALAEPFPVNTSEPPRFEICRDVALGPYLPATTGKQKAQWKAERRGRGRR